MTWFQIHVSKVVRRPGCLSRRRRFTVPWWFLALLFWLGMAMEGAHSWLPYSTAAYWLCNSPPGYQAVQSVPTGLVKVSCRREAKHKVEIMKAAVVATAAQNDVFCYMVSVTFACA